jgi:ElaB/YqjD/DUF883 family membrane-anchored ribosome-binding protein
MSNPFSNDASHAIDSAANAADQAIRDTQRATHNAMDHLAGGVESARSSLGPALDGLAHDSSQMAQRGSEAVARTARQWRDQAVQLRQSTRGYIEHQPLQSVLLAMAAGAALVLLGSLLGRGRHGGHGGPGGR